MKHCKRFLPLALSAALLAGCSPQASEPQPEPPAANTGTVAYVPLDDRPDNAERAVYLAQSLGYRVSMPEEVLYRTALDGQEKNFDALQRGEPWSLSTWVLQQEEQGCDHYILSLDQLHSGGLVSSRSLTGDELDLPGGGTVSASQILGNLLAKLAEDENNVVWLLDSVMRLAPTVGYGGFGLNEYNALRNYGMASRPHLSGGSLTVGKIVDDYPLSADGSPLAVQSEQLLPENAVENYLAARERKLRLSDQVQHILAQPGYENFHLLIGVDDSSAEDSIQRNEIAYLRANLREGDALLSGVDDLAFKAVAKLYLDHCGWQGADIQISYFGGTEDQPACAYDYQPLDAIVQEHLDFFGLRRAETGKLALLVLTQPAEESQKNAYIQALIRQLNANQKNGLPTILMDAANNTYGTVFHDALTRQADLGWPLAYSGFLDMAIVTGTALSHGVARYAWLRHGEPADFSSSLAFARTLADSVVKDFCYRNTVRDELYAYVRDTMGGSPDNFCNPPIDSAAVQARLAEEMEKSTQAVLKNFRRSNLIVGLEPYTEQGWGNMTLSDWSFPWQRVFEIRMDIAPGMFTDPHKGWFR